jgi:hypothetical protein
MRVATVTPIYRATVSRDEAISLRHLQHFLSAHDNIIIAPKGLPLDLPGFKIKRFAARDFVSIQSYNELLLSRRFYKAFLEYDYILIYQPDSLVFSSNLERWCDLGYDYIGAPWFKDFALQHSADTPLWAVGNGGFSLRKVASFLEVFDSKQRWVDPAAYWKEYYASKSWKVRALNSPKYILKKMGFANGVARQLKRRKANEDVFWGMEALHYKSDFLVAPVDVALSFAFEMDPQYCFERNERRLPFGCHAWATYDRSFWEHHLITARPA